MPVLRVSPPQVFTSVTYPQILDIFEHVFPYWENCGMELFPASHGSTPQEAAAAASAPGGIARALAYGVATTAPPLARLVIYTSDSIVGPNHEYGPGRNAGPSHTASPVTVVSSTVILSVKTP